MNIHLAIPHYNAPKQLDTFLARAVQLGFDSVTVLDDASADQDVVRMTVAKYPGVQLVVGEKNVGAGANRNRSLEVIADGIMTFIDCDIDIISDAIVEIIRQEFLTDHHHMVGGIIQAKSGQPMSWNYGHEMHPVRDAQFGLLASFLEGDGQTRAWRQLGELGMDYAWLLPEVSPKRRLVDWVAEGCFALSVDHFRQVGGYDESFRYHEGQDLAHRLRENGVEVYVEPTIVVRHLEIDVRHADRENERYQSAQRFYEKYYQLAPSAYDYLIGQG